MVRRLVERARSLNVAVLCIKDAARPKADTYGVRQNK